MARHLARMRSKTEALPAIAQGVNVSASDRAGRDWTAVVRRQPVRIVGGQPEGGHTSLFEIICRDCGDDPGREYRDVAPELQQLRGPYPIRAGVEAF